MKARYGKGMAMKQVILISGKAKNVFKYVEILNRCKGNMSLKDLSKGKKTLKIDLK